MSFLDFGCGEGIADRILVDKVGHIHGIDIAAEVLEKARIMQPDVNYLSYDGTHIPFNDNTFDVSFAMCVYHHILPQQRQNLISEMKRVTRQDGIIAVFEHNPWNMLTQIAVKRCILDKDAILLKAKELRDLMESAGLKSIETRYILLTPWKGGFFTNIEHALSKTAMGTQYYVMGRA